MRPALALGLLIAAPAATLAGCDAAGLDDFEPEVAVSATLLAGELLPPVHLALTGPIDAPYDPAERAIGGAEVTIALLSADGAVEATYAYSDDPGVPPGIYYADSLVRVLPERRYRLVAVVPGFEAPVTAETTVPRVLEIVRPPPDTVVFQQGESPALDVTPSGVDGEQGVYVFTINALAPSVEALTPFAADLFFERDVDFEDLVSASSPLVNEGNAEPNDDGSLRINLPWFGFNFYGPNEVVLTSLNRPLATFLEFQAIQFVPTTISPGEIPNVPTNVVGGVGIVGGAAQARTTLVIARP